jgi:hypothetical protein
VNAVRFGDCAATVMPFSAGKDKSGPDRISQSPEQEYKYILALGEDFVVERTIHEQKKLVYM